MTDLNLLIGITVIDINTFLLIPRAKVFENAVFVVL